MKLLPPFPRRRPGPGFTRGRGVSIWVPAFAGMSGLFLAVLVWSCASNQAPAAPPPAPVAADGSIRVIAKPVALNPADLGQTRVGVLAFAGGVELTSPDTSRFHGLSGMDVAEDGRSFIEVTDEGDLVRGRLKLDAGGRLVGMERVTLAPLRGEDGRPLQGKAASDAEGVTWLPGGGFAVSFEREHRVIAYSAGRPRMVFRADAAKAREMGLTDNGGLEALAYDGDDLFAGSERGRVWRFRKGILASSDEADEPPRGYSLTGLDALTDTGGGAPEGPDLLAVYRAYDPFRGAMVVIAYLPTAICIRGPCNSHARLELARLAPPLSVDNFEAIAAVPRPNGGWRLYILSDDNFSARQRTLLLAFDWAP